VPTPTLVVGFVERVHTENVNAVLVPARRGGLAFDELVLVLKQEQPETNHLC